MKKIILHNTAVGSRNMGDYIIMQSAKRELKSIIEDKLVVELPTHTPPLRFRAVCKLPFHKNSKSKELSEYQYGLVCGTNLLEKSMMRRQAQWNITLSESKFLKNNIFVGVGAGTIGKINLYTRLLLKRTLSNKYIHSVRDEEARQMLEQIGIKSINTGCVTMWMLTKKHCQKIPQTKSRKVVFTLTDYSKDKANDRLLIDILKRNYNEIYYWIQGSQDLEYIKSLVDTKDINFIYPSLENYEDFLKNNDCDYVGTRLHAGVKAMQEFKRSIILIVDNRARSIHKKNNIVAVERQEISNKLEKLINSSFKTKIELDEDAINSWKKQFIENE